MKVSDFDYFLPDELIAQEPVEPRDESRLLVLHQEDGRLEHRLFKDITEYLVPGDLLVMNNTRVIPARLFGNKSGTGARVEVFLLSQLGDNQWEVLVRPGKRLKPGSRIDFGIGLTGEVTDTTEAGGRIIKFDVEGDFDTLLHRFGQIPLPPYIKKPLANSERYQTVYAKHQGSVAAPTAGLHFTPDLIDRLTEYGVKFAFILLHVGLGTFRPVKVDEVAEHKMHAEFFEISGESAEIINQQKKSGGRLIAVGTTTVRTLESAANPDGMVNPGRGWTDIFIYPGYKFKVIDGLITNFHLPRSTLLMLVAALAGTEKVLAAYHEAVRLRYRFFSFGDAMLII